MVACRPNYTQLGLVAMDCVDWLMLRRGERMQGCCSPWCAVRQTSKQHARHLVGGRGAGWEREVCSPRGLLQDDLNWAQTRPGPLTDVQLRMRSTLL